MPEQQRIQPPSFDDFEGDVFVPDARPEVQTTQPASNDPLAGTIAAQESILDSGWQTFFVFSLALSLVFAVGAVYYMIRVSQIRRMEGEYFRSLPVSGVARRVLGIGVEEGVVESPQATRWQKVETLALSENPNDRRQAIIEADVMLEDAITQKGYTGEGLGEKLKQVTRADVNTIDDAWEAHKVRNRIAHDGSDVELSSREARRIISLFEGVFRELKYLE